MMELFAIIILLFTSFVILSIAFGSLAICVKCIQARRRRRLGPLEEEQIGGGDQLDKWPNMASALKQQQLEEEGRRQMNNGILAENKQVHIQVQPIAGIIVVRPSLPSIQQPQIEISRTAPLIGGGENINRQAAVAILANQKSSSSESAELDRQQQMEEHHPATERRQASTETSLSSNLALESGGREKEARILTKEKEFKSMVWMSQGGGGADELREEEEEEEEEPDTARKVESPSTAVVKAAKNDDEKGKVEEEGEEEEQEAKSEEKEEIRETQAEKAERELLGTKSEDLPEDKEAELEEKEAIKKAIGPPEPKIE